MSQAEKSLTVLTGDVKEQLNGLHGKLDQLVTKDTCAAQSKQNLETTQRYVQAAVQAIDEKRKERKPLLEQMREKAIALTAIIGLLSLVGAGLYKVVLFIDSVEAMTKKQQQTVQEELTAVKHAVNKEREKVYINYDPEGTYNPPAYAAPPPRRYPAAHRRPRSKRAAGPTSRPAGP